MQQKLQAPGIDEAGVLAGKRVQVVIQIIYSAIGYGHAILFQQRRFFVCSQHVLADTAITAHKPVAGGMTIFLIHVAGNTAHSLQSNC